MGPLEITRDNYTAYIAMAKLPVALFVLSKKYPRGKQLSYVAQHLGEEFGDDILVATINAEKERSLAEGFTQPDTPMVLVIKDGYVLAKTTELQKKDAVARFIKQSIAEAEKAALMQKADEAARKSHHWWRRNRFKEK